MFPTHASDTPSPLPEVELRLAIIGAGPAGLSLALQAARALMQVDERGQVLVDGLVDFIEVVPDGRIGGVHLAHGIGVSGSDRAEQAIGDAVHLGLGEC